MKIEDKLSDKEAADTLLFLLEAMRETNRPQGRIEIIVDGGRVRMLRIVRISDSVCVKNG
jgi:hypothetical protein